MALLTLCSCGGTTTDGSGSESHFACQRDTDCQALGASFTCVAERCISASAGADASKSAGSGGDAEPGSVASASVDARGTSSPPGAADGGATTPAPSTGGCPLDYSSFDGSGPAISFKRDVMPIFGLSCVTSQCHDADAPAAQLYLGPRCQYDPETSTCEYSQTVLDDATVNLVWQNLLAPSLTAPAMNRVTPGEPAASFLLHSVAGCQNALGLECFLQDPIGSPPCGDEMPPGAALIIQRDGERHDRIAHWVAQGALNN